MRSLPNVCCTEVVSFSFKLFAQKLYQIALNLYLNSRPLSLLLLERGQPGAKDCHGKNPGGGRQLSARVAQITLQARQNYYSEEKGGV